MLQLASQHQGDQAIDSLAGLTLNPESAPSHQSPQASAQLPANNADASGGIKALFNRAMATWLPSPAPTEGTKVEWDSDFDD